MEEKKPLVKNRKAFHEYEIFSTYEAGIVLVGSEVKSLRSQGASLQDAYIFIEEQELWLINASIAPYPNSSYFQHKERRKRKLLMHRKEITKLKKQAIQKGITLIPLSLYWKKGKIKVLLACAKGKKLYDKRASLREKEQKKQMERASKKNL